MCMLGICVYVFIYDMLSILSLAVIFAFANAYNIFTTIHKDFTFGSHIYSFTPMTTYVLLVWQTLFFLIRRKLLKQPNRMINLHLHIFLFP